MASSTRRKASQGALDFEKALEELEALVERMEQGDMPLEEALKSFEHGIRLTRACQKALAEAEQKVRMLMEETQGRPFED